MPSEERQFASSAFEIDRLLESVFGLLYHLETEAALSEKGRQYLTLAEQELQRVTQNARPALDCSRDLAASDTATLGFAQCRVFCVDDEPSSLRRRQVILEYKGYLVSTASTVADALAIFRATDFGLVITGHHLGRGTATAMAREMKCLKPNVPIIMLSNATDSSDAVETVDAFISNAEVPEGLLAKVDELAVRSRSVSAGAALPINEEFSTYQENAQLLAGIVESSDDAIFSKTLEGTIMTWNKAAENMYGYRAEEIIGKSVALLQPFDCPGEVHEILQRLRNGEKVKHFEATRVAKDGHKLSVALTISPIRGASGQVIGASTIARETSGSALAGQTPRNAAQDKIA